MQSSAKSALTSAWFSSTPEGKRQQVDAAMEYALEATLAKRPPKPLLLMAQKLREWDAAVYGTWEPRGECEKVFARGDAAGSGTIDLTPVQAMLHENKDFGELVRRTAACL